MTGRSVLGMQRAGRPGLIRPVFGYFLLLGFSTVTIAEGENANAPTHQSVIAPLAVKSPLLDVISADSRLIAVGERGHVLLSDNDGLHWNQVGVPTQSLLTAISFGSDDQGVVVGHDTTILFTEDKGTHWQRVYYDSELEQPLFDVWLSGEKQGVAIGAYGLYLQTHDGGRSWAQSELVFELQEDAHNNSDDDLPPDFHLYSIKQINGILFIVGEAGTLYRSSNSGKSWQSLASPYRGTYYGVTEVNGGDVLIYGLQGHCYLSRDSGESWQQIDTGTRSSLVNGLQLTDGRIMLVGFSGIVLELTREYSLVSTSNLESRSSLSSLVAVQNELIFTGSHGIERVGQASLLVPGSADD